MMNTIAKPCMAFANGVPSSEPDILASQQYYDQETSGRQLKEA